MSPDPFDPPPTQEQLDLAIEQRDEARRLANRLRRERDMALSVKTREGLTASEWVLRTGLAEARADNTRRRMDDLIEEVYAAGHYRLCERLQEQLDIWDREIFTPLTEGETR